MFYSCCHSLVVSLACVAGIVTDTVLKVRLDATLKKTSNPFLPILLFQLDISLPQPRT